MENTGLYAFTFFALLTFALPRLRQKMLARSFADWQIDLMSLAVHLAGLPLLQGALIFGILGKFRPEWRASLPSPAWLSIALYLLLDYLWYWNHRIFHADSPLWKLHKTHHSAEHLDVLMSARNSLLSHFAMIYFWFMGLAVYLLADPRMFLALAAFGGVVNFWGHTSFNFRLGGRLDRALALLIVSPQDHHWHHSRENPRCNYGTVLNVWDRLHGTYFKPARLPITFGEPGEKHVWDELVWPFSS